MVMPSFFSARALPENAQATDGRKCPTTQELTEKLSAQFLGGKYKTAPLNQVRRVRD